MISISVDGSGVVETIYHGQQAGDGWIQLDRNLPEVKKSNVAVTWYYDGDKLTFDTEPIPEDDDLL